MKPINRFLLDHQLWIHDNPCISPDFCLDWNGMLRDIRDNRFTRHPASEVHLPIGKLSLLSNPKGDHAWLLEGGTSSPPFVESTVSESGMIVFPATYENLIHLKNLIQESHPESTLFPSAEGTLSHRTIGVGARFTTLHWPGVFWTMKQVGMGLTANQNSIPRELVYDVDKMLEGQLERVPFPFIGSDVPEGHQGQSVQGMAHGCILENLKTGFHRAAIPWSFNADHQPIGGRYDSREKALVEGCLFASYITFDLSPELAQTEVPSTSELRAKWVASNIDSTLVDSVGARAADAGYTMDSDALNALLCYVWPAMVKMKARDELYQQIRQTAFTTEKGRAYLRELSIDELPGITKPETTAVMLALCEQLGMPVQFVAPAFGFQKNLPYDDQPQLEAMVHAQWSVCSAFGVSIGFHSGSGKSAQNYQALGHITNGNLEIKTSGRYTYEMGVALSQSPDPGDQALWKDWFAFTAHLAAQGAFSEQASERDMARSFIDASYQTLNQLPPASLYNSHAHCLEALLSLPPNPDLMMWFEYNFLYVLAADGQAVKSALGDHSPSGYIQRSRFYRISESGSLLFCKGIALYLLFLLESTGLVPHERCAQARLRLASVSCLTAFLGQIAEG